MWWCIGLKWQRLYQFWTTTSTSCREYGWSGRYDLFQTAQAVFSRYCLVVQARGFWDLQRYKDSFRSLRAAQYCTRIVQSHPLVSIKRSSSKTASFRGWCLRLILEGESVIHLHCRLCDITPIFPSSSSSSPTPSTTISWSFTTAFTISSSSDPTIYSITITAVWPSFSAISWLKPKPWNR